MSRQITLAESLNGMSSRVFDAIPSIEPICKNGTWNYRVSRPFIAPGALENVVNCISDGLISSATRSLLELESELREFHKVPMAKVCNSGYSALLLSLRLARIGEDAEVIIPSMTMIAVANAVQAVGAKVVFADNSEGKLNPGVLEYKQNLTLKTKAVIVTYTYGTTIDMQAIRSLCDSKDIVLIEDISEAIGTVCQRKLVGTIGHYAAASLYANKLVTAGDGGFILSTLENDDIYDRATSYTNHGFVAKYHFLHFEHSGNYKMSGLAAALATPAIAFIPEVAEHRRFVAQKYREYLAELKGVELMEVSEFGPDAPWVFGVVCESMELKDHIRSYIAYNGGVETRDYFLPVHLQPVFQIENDEPPSLPNCERMSKRGFYLPTHYYLTDIDIKCISGWLRLACDEIASI